MFDGVSVLLGVACGFEGGPERKLPVKRGQVPHEYDPGEEAGHERCRHHQAAKVPAVAQRNDRHPNQRHYRRRDDNQTGHHEQLRERRPRIHVCLL
jgi:hypothetical protein